MDAINYEYRLKKLINRYLAKSRRFCDRYCYPYGLHDIVISTFDNKRISKDILYSNKLLDDFEYFIFAKSTKTLHAIRELANNMRYHFNEDIMILIRSIFEGYLASRYLRTYIHDLKGDEEIIKDFVKNPIGIITDYYFTKGNSVRDKSGKEVGKIRNPHQLKLGQDEKYYSDFYLFLCQFAHNSFGLLRYYFDDSFFLYDKNNLALESLLFAIFSFSKVFEGIVTVSMEELGSKYEERDYYDLVYDSIELQEEVFDYLICQYNTISADKLDWIIQLYLYEGDPNGKIRRMINMLEKMKKSLYEQIGNVKKEVDDKGKLVRQYPSYN